MEITTGTGIFCEHCSREIQITTQGMLGGITAQAAAASLLTRIKEDGGKIKCGKCGRFTQVSGKAKT